MNETITLIERIYQLGPGIIAGVILVLGATRRWCWYYQLEQCEARGAAAVAAAEKREQLWRELYFAAMQTNKALVDIQKAQGATGGSA